MKRVKLNYRALHVLMRAEPRLHKALITNCNKELVNCISDCVLHMVNGNLKLSDCNTSRLQKHKSALRKVADTHVSLSGKKRLIAERGVFLLPLLSVILPTNGGLIFKSGKNVTYDVLRPGRSLP